MKELRWFCAFAVVALVGPAVTAQDAPKPGPEHEVLKKLEGTWTLVMKFGGMESKGTLTNKMELGGLWLVGNMESDLFGAKFTGKSLETYDPAKKKYNSYWFDSMGTAPVVMEGTYDKAAKKMTMSGEGPGMDGKPMKYRSVSEMPDDDTINFSMYMGDTKEPSFTIVYKRKK